MHTEEAGKSRIASRVESKIEEDKSVKELKEEIKVQQKDMKSHEELFNEFIHQ